MIFRPFVVGRMRTSAVITLLGMTLLGMRTDVEQQLSAGAHLRVPTCEKIILEYVLKKRRDER